MKEMLKCRGDWTIKTVNRETGEVISEEKQNTIVNVGLERIAKLLFDVDTPAYFRAIGIGTDNTAVTNSDTVLGAEFDRELGVATYVASYIGKLTKTFTFGSGVSQTITEAGIFDSDTVSGSTMLARVVFAGKSISSLIDLIVEAEITFARA